MANPLDKEILTLQAFLEGKTIWGKTIKRICQPTRVFAAGFRNVGEFDAKAGGKTA